MLVPFLPVLLTASTSTHQLSATWACAYSKGFYSSTSLPLRMKVCESVVVMVTLIVYVPAVAAVALTGTCTFFLSGLREAADNVGSVLPVSSATPTVPTDDIEALAGIGTVKSIATNPLNPPVPRISVISCGEVVWLRDWKPQL